MPKTRVSVIDDDVKFQKENQSLKEKIKELETTTIKKPLCVCCGNSGSPNLFYNTSNALYAGNDYKLPICKECLQKEYGEMVSKYGDGDLAIYFLCRELNLFFSKAALEAARQHSLKVNCSLIAAYMKTINTKLNGSKYGTCFNESKDFLDIEIIEENLRKQIKRDSHSVEHCDVEVVEDTRKSDEANKNDCITLLGSDPFKEEAEELKPYLYNMLVDYLDEATLDDPFKKSNAIAIVKMFGQMEAMDREISKMSTTDGLTSKAYNDLVASKKKMYETILRSAKENGISELYATNKSAGAGTLSGLMKKQMELNLRAIEENKFDAEICEGFKQVAQISNNAIIEKLNLKEDETFEMIAQQRQKIFDLDHEVSNLREKLRKYELAEFESKES